MMRKTFVAMTISVEVLAMPRAMRLSYRGSVIPYF
jgi:hypothetical protein